MKRFAALFLACCAFPLLGATINLLPKPSVVVYPLTSSGSMTADAGGQIAVLLATKLSENGDIEVKPFTPGTTRSQYLDAARAAGADYYITGFLTPLGNEVNLIEQVVSTESGSVVWSGTATVKTFGEAAQQSDAIHSAILRHAGRVLSAYEVTPTAAPSETPEPKNDIFGMFHRKRGTAEASPKPTGSAAAAPLAIADVQKKPTWLIARVDGDAATADRTYATDALAHAIGEAGFGSNVLADHATGVSARAEALCTANAGASAIYAGMLSLGDSRSGPKASFDLSGFDCAGHTIGHQHIEVTASDAHAAIDAAIAKATAPFFRSSKKRT